jgi:hypothetical protein
MDFLKRNLFMKKGVKINNELAEVMEQQLKNFREKFGREMGPDDPIFFDPDCDVPMPLTEAKLKNELIEAACKAGLDVGRVLSAFGFEDDEEGVAKDF